MSFSEGPGAIVGAETETGILIIKSGMQSIGFFISISLLSSEINYSLLGRIQWIIQLSLTRN